MPPGGEVIAACALVDRSAGEVDLGVPFFPLVEINFPTYAAGRAARRAGRASRSKSRGAARLELVPGSASASTSITSPRSATRAAATIPIRCARPRSSRRAAATASPRTCARTGGTSATTTCSASRTPTDLPLNLEMAATEEMLAIALRPQTARRLHRARKARGAHHRGRARRRRAAQPPAADRQPPDRRRHPRQPVHRGRASARSKPRCGSARRWSSSTPANTPMPRATNARRELKRLADMAALAAKNGIEPHAGHGLTYDNVQPVAAIPQLAELNIGHYLIGEAIFVGLEAAVRADARTDGRGADDHRPRLRPVQHRAHRASARARYGERFELRCFTEIERAKAARRPFTKRRHLSPSALPPRRRFPRRSAPGSSAGSS